MNHLSTLKNYKQYYFLMKENFNKTLDFTF